MSSSSESSWEDADESEIDKHLRHARDVAIEVVRLVLENEIEGTSNSRPTGPNKRRGRVEAHDKLVADYFSDNLIYNNDDFKRRFRMTRQLYVRIVADLEREFDYFKQAWDARGVNGSAADSIDEYLRMGETTARDCIDNFCQGIIHLYMRKYLRKPTANDVHAIYALHEGRHGLPDMLGSIDCMHWYWKNCPFAWRGQYHIGDHPGPSVILEAVASYDLWIWHTFFGVPGATNDVVVVNQSPIFDDLFEDKAPDSSFYVNDTHYKHRYYLADEIYPKWTTFVKAFKYLMDERRVKFKERQESARKYIEREFAVLQEKWHVLTRLTRVWTHTKLREIMYTCVILHNMIRKDKGFSHYNFDETEVLTEDIETTISEEARAINVNQVKN